MVENTRYRRLLSILCAAFILLGNATAVFAEGTTSINVSSKSPEVGDNFSVTVSGSESGSISVKYNNNVMELSGVNADSYNTNGNIVTFSGKEATLSFKATAAGSGDVVVTSDTLSGSSTSVPVADSKREEEEKKEEEKKEEEKKEEKKEESEEDGDFVIDGVAYVLSERFTEEEIPEGFERKQLKFASGTYRELASDFMTLVYLKPASDTSGSGEFYIYNEEDNSVTPMVKLGGSKNYVIVTEAMDMPADNLVEKEFEADDVKCKGYQPEGVENDFYFVYGTNSDGEGGWYSYDSARNTLQRANTDLITKAATAKEETEDENKEEETSVFGGRSIGDFKFTRMFKDLNNARMLLAVLVFAAVVLIIIIIDIVLFRRGRDEEDEDDFLMTPPPAEPGPERNVTQRTAERNERPEEPEEEQEVEVLTLDDVLDDVEEDLKKETKARNKSRRFGRKAENIWDDEKKEGTGNLPGIDDRSLKRQVFKNDTGHDTTENKVDIIDFNDL